MATAVAVCFGASCSEGSDTPRAATPPATAAATEPGAETLAFLVTMPERDEGLYSVGVDGQDLQEIGPAPGILDWSPDGSRIVYSDGRPPQIWVMDADGGNKQRLTEYEDGAESPTWSHDGRRIAFTRGRWADDYYNAAEIYAMDADGDNKTQVTDNEVAEGGPTWSPDGDRIAVTQTGPQATHSVAVVDVATGDETDVTPDVVPDPWLHWSSRGRIAFTSSLSGNGVWTMSPDGSDLRELELDASVPQARTPAWSPDGDQIAFVAAEIDMAAEPGEDVSDLYVIPAGGGRAEKVLAEPWFILFVDWIPGRGDGGSG